MRQASCIARDALRRLVGRESKLGHLRRQYRSFPPRPNDHFVATLKSLDIPAKAKVLAANGPIFTAEAEAQSKSLGTHLLPKSASDFVEAVREELPYVVILDGDNASTATVLTCIEVQVPVVIVLSANDIQWSDIEPKLSAQGVTRIIGPGATGVTLPNLNLFAARESDIVSGKPGRIGIISTDKKMPSELLQHLKQSDVGQPTLLGLGSNQDGTTVWEALQWLLADDVVEVICITGPRIPKREADVEQAYAHYIAHVPANQKPKDVYRLAQQQATSTCQSSETSSSSPSLQNPLHPNVEVDDLGLPLNPPALPEHILDPPPAAITVDELRKLHRMAALIPPTPGSPEEAELLADLSKLVGLMDRVKTIELKSNPCGKTDAIRRLLSQAAWSDSTQVIDGSDMHEGQPGLRHVASVTDLVTRLKEDLAEIDARKSRLVASSGGDPVDIHVQDVPP